MSASLVRVSSNPGVSMSATLRPLSSNDCAVSITLVQECNPLPMCRFELLAKLMNYTPACNMLSANRMPDAEVSNEPWSFRFQLLP